MYQVRAGIVVHHTRISEHLSQRGGSSDPTGQRHRFAHPKTALIDAAQKHQSVASGCKPQSVEMGTPSIGGGMFRISMLFQEGAGSNEFTEVEAGYPLHQAAKHLHRNVVTNFACAFDLL